MASDRAALRKLRAADPIPHRGPELVRYMGGTTEAARILSGMAGPPPTSLRRSNPEQYADESRRWRDASRQAQRWAKGERGVKTDPVKQLDAKQRRQAQTANRDRKRAAAQGGGIRAQLRNTRIVIVSGKAGRRDSRRRSIVCDPDDGARGVLIEDHVTVLQLVAAGELEEAAELLADGFLERCGLPAAALEPGGAGTTLEAADWILWPDGEDPPPDALGGDRR